MSISNTSENNMYDRFVDYVNYCKNMHKCSHTPYHHLAMILTRGTHYEIQGTKVADRG